MHVKAVRRGIPALLLATAGLALAACGSTDAHSSASSAPSSSARASSPAGSAPAATSGSDSTGVTSTDTAGSATPGGGGSGGMSGGTEPACKTSQLKTTVANRSSGAGHTTFQIVFQNTGSSPCTLSGYPGVSFVKAHNTQLGKAASRTDGKASIVTLIPNAHAYADVRTVNGQGGYSAARCDLTTVPTLRVYPPNQKESTNIPWNEKECVGPTVQNLQVGPVHTER